ncbi:MAG: 1-(5-phosphoribosyl)-5-[(5-phosphoribosylamino)methylideneamino]imidazole-4-carboxamide isomerase [Actinomycetota bacterium]|nr:1-(5-phosphoribosyl)-5-[(5-phosphoribosylamino)methylideneamino]imidazole-4-carboxamide isomerase [Actinomycetota bacterium]
MIVVPAIDLRGGRCVRLVRGDPAQQTVYKAEPSAVARVFEQQGAELLHVVDLDAAFGTGENQDTITEICDAVEIPVQVGGGLRSVVNLMQAQIAGASRVVLGTAAALDPDFVRSAVNRYRQRVVVAVDVMGDRVMVDGWRTDAGALADIIPAMERANAPRFLVTSIDVDGTMEGPDLDLYDRLRQITMRPVQASGGVRSPEDLAALAALGVEAAIVGRALYEGTISLSEATSQ